MDQNPFELKSKAATATYPHFIDLFLFLRLDSPRRGYFWSSKASIYVDMIGYKSKLVTTPAPASSRK